MKSFVVVTALATAALAATSSSSAAAAASTANPLIPTGISSGCTTFLNQLDTNSDLSSCTSALISASSAFGPSASTSSAPSASDVNTALSSICGSAASSCTESTVRGMLANFYSACSAELSSSPNADVVRTYDVLYALTPLKNAICTKDSTGKYCATQASSPTASSSSAAASGSSAVTDAKVNVAVSSTPDLSAIKQYLWNAATAVKRATTTAAIVPNVTTFHDSNLLFLFLKPDMDSTELCTSCTRDVLTSYIDFESAVPYAAGLTNSPLMSGQSDLYNAILTTCGKTFFSGAVQAAGGISAGLVSNRAPTQAPSGMLTAVFGAVVLGFAAML